jgi:hypothetical protein
LVHKGTGGGKNQNFGTLPVKQHVYTNQQGDDGLP